MQPEDLEFRINLVQFRIKFIFALFCLFLLLLGSGVTFIFFSQDLSLFLIATSFPFFTTLLIASLLFVFKNRPDHSSPEHSNYKPYLLLLFVVFIGIIFFMSLYSTNEILAILILSIFQGLFDLLAFGFIGMILIPKRFIIFNKKTNELQYMSDFKTKRVLKVVNLNNVSQIDIGSKESKSVGGGSTRLYFTFKGNQNYSFNSNLGVMWILRTYTNAETFYELLRIFVNYPIFVRSNSKILLRPLRDIFNKPVSPTSAAFSYNDSNRLNSIFQNSSRNFEIQEQSFSTDSGFSDYSSFSDESHQKNDFITLNQNKHNTAKEVKGDRFSRTNKTATMISLIVGLTYIYLTVIIISIALDNFFGTNFLELIFKQQITPGVDQLLELVGFFLILSFLAPYFFLLSAFGREFLLFQDQLIIYQIKVFNKVSFTRNIPVKAVINIECPENKGNISMRLLGGDIVSFWRGDILERSEKLRELQTLLI